MGYTTEFEGTLMFQGNVTVPMLAKLKTFMGEDCRDHPEWGTKDLSYIDLEIASDFSGIKWSGAEKTYDMVDLVNLVITEMLKEFPEFSLMGVLTAQGESIEDRWQLFIGEDGFAHKREVVVVGSKVECPDCGHVFFVEKSCA